MKSVVMFLALTVLLLVGCEYDSPLTKEHSIAVDSAVLGLWEPIPAEGEEPKQDLRMAILKFSDTEYLVHYSIWEDDLYFRCYPIEIGGISCIQLQVIGSSYGPPLKVLFHVVSYQVMNDELEIRVLNTHLVDCDLKTMEGLVDAFLKHKDNKELFTDPGRFRKIKE
jgi:hypothetical protein